jgi:hypothetical protein
MLRGNYLLKQLIEGKIEGRREVAERLERRSKQLLNDFKRERRYCKLKEKSLDRTLWRFPLEAAVDMS